MFFHAWLCPKFHLEGVLKLKEMKIMFEFITTILLDIPLFFSSVYIVTIKIYVTIYLEREK